MLKGPRRAGVAAACLLAVAAAALPALTARRARTLLLDLGPNDADYVLGFRPQWEREGRTRFHWTLAAATVRLPVRAKGAGHVLRLRARRHFVEPSQVALTVEGRVVGLFSIQAHSGEPYHVLEFPLPPLEGRVPFAVVMHSRSEGASPLQVALDWMELRRAGPAARFAAPAGMLAGLALAAVVAFAAVRLGGLGLRPALAHGAMLTAAGAVGAWWDLLATERIVREGVAVYAATAAAAVVLARWTRSRRALGITSPPVAGALVLVVMVALAVRLILLLHPWFFYPDVRVHALFARELAKQGLGPFLRDFTLNQFRYSLGLQLENGHWYAFPYPPAFYVLAWPLVRIARYRPEVAISVLAAAVNSLGALVVYGIGRRLGLCVRVSLGGAAALPLLPIFIARLTLAYFPALVGHAVDAIVILYLVAHLRQTGRPRVVLTLAALVALALLTYTQSLLNLGILVPLVLLLQLGSRESGAGRRALGLATAGALGAVLAVAIFYARYVPVFLDMRRGVPMAGEEIVLERAARQTALGEDTSPEPPDDPFAGPGIRPLRGLSRGAWRLLVFYGPFAPVVLAGVLLLVRQMGSLEARFVTAWALTYVALNLAAGGLPGPNLVRYNKDMEVVAPLACLALASVGAWLHRRGGRWSALAYAGAFCAFAAWRAASYFVASSVVER